MTEKLTPERRAEMSDFYMKIYERGFGVVKEHLLGPALQDAANDATDLLDEVSRLEAEVARLTEWRDRWAESARLNHANFRQMWPALGEMRTRAEQAEADARLFLWFIRSEFEDGQYGTTGYCYGCGASNSEHEVNCRWPQFEEAQARYRGEEATDD